MSSSSYSSSASTRHGSSRDRDRDRDRESSRRGEGHYRSSHEHRSRDRDEDERDRRHREERDRDGDSRRGKSSSSHSHRKREEELSNEERSRQASEHSGSRRGEDGRSNGAEDSSMHSNSTSIRKEPLSLEELLKKKKEIEDAKSRPVFLTKQQREELKKRDEEERQQEKEAREKQNKKKLDEFRQEARYAQRKEYDRRREEEKKKKDAPKSEDLEKDIIKKTYLKQLQPEKKKILKPAERLSRIEDWDEDDDTSKDINPLYSNPRQATLLFGRGMRAGVDRKVQQEKSREFEEVLAEKVIQMEEEGTPTQVDPLGVRQLHASNFSIVMSGSDRAEQIRSVSERLRTTDDLYKYGKHWSEKSLNEMDERDWRILREDFEIATKGGSIPKPLRNWEEAHLHPALQQAINDAKFERPTPIQMQCIPIGLQNRDCIGLAETGSGKTLAFVIPMLMYISTLPKMTRENMMEGPYAIVLAPTRELAGQIEKEARSFSSALGIRVYSIVGGVSVEEQTFALREGCEIIIGTPGRMVDLLDNRMIVLNQCKYVVLDEADRMIDMGFDQELEKILSAMPVSNLAPEDETGIDPNCRYRQTFMFSATMPPKVERVAREFMRRPATVMIGRIGQANLNVEQRVKWCRENEKWNLLLDILRSEDPPIIIFLNSKKAVDVLHRQLERAGFSAVYTHGGRSQDQREAALKDFKSGEYDILVATDVAGRGIDVEGVTHVINYEAPKDIERYTHRIGRTGRAGRQGIASTFLTADDTDIMYHLKKMLEESNQFIPSELAQAEAAQAPPGTVADKPRRKQIVYVGSTQK